MSNTYYRLPVIAIILLCLRTITAYCDDPSPAFPIPRLGEPSSEFNELKIHITESVQALLASGDYNTSAFSLEITSQTETIFDIHAGAKVVNEGARRGRGTNAFRIASMTKPFTVLAILQQVRKGNLNLEDPVNKYIAALNEPQNGTLPWKDITIRALATQISGIPRDLSQSDYVTNPAQAAKLGLPPLDSKHEGVPQCDSIVNYTVGCTADDLLDWVKRQKPVFAPNQESTYSNLNFELLGLVLENVTGKSYEKYVEEEILSMLHMNGTSFDTPSESRMVIPVDTSYYWNFTMGIADATGGLYSCSSDLAKFMRYALTHYNGLHVLGLNWFQPTSYSGSSQTFYGMPWEIYRTTTDKILGENASTRPITFNTKGGGLPGYTSIIMMNPEYGFGMTILVAGNPDLMSEIQLIATRAMVHYAEAMAQKQTRSRYTGTFVASSGSGINSSVTLEWSPQRGLLVTRFVSNGTDVRQAVADMSRKDADDILWQVVPTLLFEDEENGEGERWRLIFKLNENKRDRNNPLDNGCITDLDTQAYAGVPLREIVFWGKDGHGKAKEVGLSAYRITLERAEDGNDVGADRHGTNAQDHFELL